MKFTLCLLIYTFASIASAEDSTAPNVRLDKIPTDQDTSILIHKGDSTIGLIPDFEIVTKQEDISGEPLIGNKESYGSWKAACSDWKKDLKSNNGDRLISANCGKARADKDLTSMEVTQSSNGTYQLRVPLTKGGAVSH